MTFEHYWTELAANLDIDRIHRAMVALDMKWGHETPNHAQIATKIRTLCETAYFVPQPKFRNTVTFGGIEATFDPDFGMLIVKFFISETYSQPEQP